MKRDSDGKLEPAHVGSGAKQGGGRAVITQPLPHGSSVPPHTPMHAPRDVRTPSGPHAAAQPTAAGNGWEGPQPGSLIDGSYRVVGPLGQGGMGMVLLAVDERLQRDVAIKLIRPTHGTDHKAIALTYVSRRTPY
jgi:serine/threonine protein kinase